MKIAVIGGGIAGCSAAYALARRGAAVTLFERNNAVAQEASGNMLGIFHPRIEKQWSAITRFQLSAFGYAKRQLAALEGQGEWWDAPGMLQFPKRRDPKKSEDRLRILPAELGLVEEVARFVEAEEASALAEAEGSHGALYFPGGTWVRPHSWCERMISAGRITVYTDARVKSLQRSGKKWRVNLDEDASFEADQVIIAAAAETSFYSPLAALPLRKVRGQITEIPATPESAKIKKILCYEGYLSPALNSVHLCGSTYEYDREDVTPDVEGNRHNIGMTERLWPDLFSATKVETLRGRAAFRAVTPDRLPMIGKMEEGLYLTLGHGSRGLLSSPLGGELLASMMYDEPLPCDREVIEILSPLRFAS